MCLLCRDHALPWLILDNNCLNLLQASGDLWGQSITTLGQGLGKVLIDLCKLGEIEIFLGFRVAEP